MMLKRPKILLHTQIMIAMVLGIVFGVIFPISSTKIEVTVEKATGNETVIINDWQEITAFTASEKVAFASDEASSISSYCKKHGEIKSLEVQYPNSKVIYENIIAVDRIESIGSKIKPIGDLFIRLLCFLAVPLVLATLISGVASLGDIRKLGRIGLRTILIYISTTTVAITIGVVLALSIEPGNKISVSEKEDLVAQYQVAAMDKAKMSENIDIDIIDFLINIVPKNPMAAIANGKMLQLIFFALMLGITLTLIDPEKAKIMVSFFDALSESMIKMVGIFMKLAPAGVFALMSATVASFGFDIIVPLFWYMLVVILGLSIQTVFVYPLILKIIGRSSIRNFFKEIREAQVVGFSTSSSAATLPISMKFAKKMGVNKDISSFTLPLGATINMDGTALYQGVAAIFIAQVYGIDLSLIQQLSIIFTAVLASIGTAPVPGLGIIMLVMILQSVGIPAEGIALILGVDRILDMLRTVTNVTGDNAVTITISNLEKRIKPS